MALGEAATSAAGNIKLICVKLIKSMESSEKKEFF